jgi:hypothetical protein
MTLRPHCLRCGSSSVSRDDDKLAGRVSISCFKCGNRQYKDTDYVGFEMREEGPKSASASREDVMAVKRACKNCAREMTIVGKGLCFTCSAAGKGLEGPKLDAALDAVKEKIASGGLRKGGRNKADRIQETDSPETIHSPIVKFHPQPAQEIPVTIRLTIEVDLRVTGVRT